MGNCSQEQNRTVRPLRIFFLTGQELSIPMCEQSGKKCIRPALLSKEVLVLVYLKHNKEMHRHWNQGYVFWEEYTDAQMYRNRVGKAKAQMELNLARDAKNSNNILYRYFGEKRVK